MPAPALGKVHIRWMIRRDMPEVLNIENECFNYPWSEQQFVKYLAQRNVVGMVAERQERVQGFMVYELHPHQLTLTNFAVHPDWQRTGVGRSLIEKLRSKMSAERRQVVQAVVAEYSVNAQLFFRSMGFVAVRTLKEHHKDEGMDGIQMELRGYG